MTKIKGRKKDYRLWKGRKVKIFIIDWSTNKRKCLGIGVYIKSRKVWFEGTDKFAGYTPEFRIAKKKIYGYECWWIPLSIANKIEKETL